MKTNVLMIGWELPPHISGGLGMACAGLTRELAGSGEVSLSFTLPHALTAEDRGYMELIGVPAQPRDAAAFPRIASAYCSSILPKVEWYGHAIVDAVRGLHPDVIHAHDWLTVPAALAAQQLSGAPLILHVHSTEFDRAGSNPDPHIRHIERLGLHSADHVIAVSDFTRNVIIERYQVPPGKISTVHNGWDGSVGTGTPRRRSVISFIGRVTEQKGPAYFIEAARLALAADPSLTFVMAGDGDLLPAMKALANDYGIDGSMSFPGFLSSDEVFWLLEQSRVFVMPSKSEPFGLAVLEAASRETPVIMSSHCGVGEVLENVAKVDYGDASAIAAWMLKLTGDAAYAGDLARRARKELARVSWQSNAQSTIELYDLLVRAPVRRYRC